MIVWHDFITHRYAWNDLLNICDMTHWCEWHDYCNMTWSRQTWHSHTTHKSIWINKSSVNPKSTSNQSSKPCTVLQYPSRTEWHDCAIGLDHVKHVTHTQSHSISVCVCVCVFVCVFVCIYTCMCMYVHVCACVCMYADLHIYVHIYKTPVHFSSVARPRLQKTPASQNLIGNEDFFLYDQMVVQEKVGYVWLLRIYDMTESSRSPNLHQQSSTSKATNYMSSKALDLKQSTACWSKVVHLKQSTRSDAK